MTTGDLPSPFDVFRARQRLSSHLRSSPLIHSRWLSTLCNASVWLKIESLQPTCSFKIRGALNAVLNLSQRSPAPRTIVTASAGNHGRAIAMAAEQLGLRAVIFTPVTAPDTKKRAIRQHGGDLKDDLPDYDAAERAAREFAETEDALYISSYNHPDVIAGAGTIALELLEALPSLDVVVIPLGGGGLASGVSLALKAASRNIRVVGVEVEASTAFAASTARGEITPVIVKPSLADGLTGNLEPGSITFELVRRHVDSLTSVTEAALTAAIRGLAGEEHLIAEGAGAAATAAVLTSASGRGLSPELRRDKGHVIGQGQRAAVLLTGGNIDLEVFAQVIGGSSRSSRSSR
jgi:threonine dehydratase